MNKYVFVFRSYFHYDLRIFHHIYFQVIFWSLTLYAIDRYHPVFFFNQFWNIQSNWVRINQTTADGKLPAQNLTLTIDFSPISYMRWMIYSNLESSFNMQKQIYGEAMQSEIDETKRIFLETNPVFLGITITVTIIHSIFDFLAFKNGLLFLLFTIHFRVVIVLNDFFLSSLIYILFFSFLSFFCSLLNRY